MSYFKADSQNAEDPEMMPSYAYNELREPVEKPDDAALWKRIRELWANDDQEGLKKLYRELEITAMTARQAC